MKTIFPQSRKVAKKKEEKLRLKQSEPAEIIQHLAHTKRCEIRHDDRRERAHPIASLQQILRPECEPEYYALGEGSECFSDNQILPSRLAIKQRRQNEHDDRIRTRRQPDAAKKLLPRRQSGRKAQEEYRCFDQDRKQISDR